MRNEIWLLGGLTVEHRVGDQSARIDRNSVYNVTTPSSIDFLYGGRHSAQLLVIQTLGIFAVVLVKVGQLVVQHDWRLEVGGNGDVDRASFDVVRMGGGTGGASWSRVDSLCCVADDVHWVGISDGG